MSYIEELRQSKNKPQVAFQEFALSTRKFSAHLFCFFEGKDNAYYVPRIKRFTEYYHPIKCGSRDSVLKTHTLISNCPEYASYRKSFFIDRDFNNPLQPMLPPIFETPCYSVENLYVSVGVFKEILTNEFHLSEVGDEAAFNACIDLFIDRQKEFHRATMLFNAWYACLMEIRNTQGTHTGVNLDDKLPNGFIDISLQSVNAHYDLERIKQNFPNSTTVEEDVLSNKMFIFQNCECHKVFRGKYEMQFLTKFIQLLLQDSNSSKTVLQNKINFAFVDNLSNQQAMNVFEGYAETPESLIDYLRTVTQ
jgi:hypothetical protein